jgi:uncharacterized protein YbjT (DUF2867 family)
MSASKPTILVIGAAGRAGGLVAAALTRRGATVRALLRHPNTAGAARANGATEIAIGDLRDPASVLEAAKGAHGVFHVGPPSCRTRRRSASRWLRPPNAPAFANSSSRR